MTSKRQTTFAKLARERMLQERRERKREKKQAAAEERRARSAEPQQDDAPETGDAETGSDDEP